MMAVFSQKALARLTLAAFVSMLLGSGAAPTQGQTETPIFLPAVLVGRPATSAELIEEGRQSGKIDDFTALLYRFYAMAGDGRLPQAYRGADSEDMGVFVEVAALLPSLPADRQAQLRAFMRYPSDPESAWSQFEAGLNSAEMQNPAPCWTSKESASPGVNAKVWAICDAESEAQVDQVLGMIEALWGPMTALMGQPLPDAGGPQQGGSTDIDIYLLYNNQAANRSGLNQTSSSRAVAPTSNHGQLASSGYILIPRGWLRNPNNFKSVLAHEFFHVLQHAHNYRVHFSDRLEWWFTEASADWAAVNFVPEHARSLHEHNFRYYFQESELSLNLREPVGSASHPYLYASYIWPFFMEMEAGPGLIGDAWELIEEAGPSQDLADQKLDGVFSFDRNFKEFAVRNLNRELKEGDPAKPRYVTFDSTFPNGKMPFPIPDVYLDEDTDWSETTDLPGLKAHYTRIRFGDEVRKVEIRLTPAADVALELLILKDGQWRREDHSGEPLVTLCDVDEIYTIASNANYAYGSFVDYTLSLETLSEPCGCSAFNLPAFSGEVTYNYHHFATNAQYDYNLNQSASGSVTVTFHDAGGTGKSLWGQPNGTATINDVEVSKHFSGSTTTRTISHSGPMLTEEFQGRPVSNVLLHMESTRCTYNLTFRAGLQGDGPTPVYVGGWSTPNLPLPEDGVLAGNLQVPAHSEWWIMDQITIDYVYEPGGFGDSMFSRVVGNYNQAGTATISWDLQPAP